MIVTNILENPNGMVIEEDLVCKNLNSVMELLDKIEFTTSSPSVSTKINQVQYRLLDVAEDLWEE